jgi:hypothetical protein
MSFLSLAYKDAKIRATKKESVNSALSCRPPNLQQLYSDASGHWHNQDLTVLSGGILGAAGSSVTAVALTVGDYERLFFLDSNRHVQQFYSDASGH